MAKKPVKKAEQTITVNGVDYVESDFNEAATTQLNNIRHVDREIEEVKNQMAILQAARQFYALQLDKEMPAKS